MAIFSQNVDFDTNFCVRAPARADADDFFREQIPAWLGCIP
jgi:hypothetical protein